MRGEAFRVGEKGSGEGAGRLTEAALRVAKYLGEVRPAGADEIGYYCEVSPEQFRRIKQILGLERRWTVEGCHTKPLYSLAEGSIWQAVFCRP